MTFNELVEAVITNTNRPELLRETKLAVQRSTIKMHQLDFFSNDLTQGSISFTPAINPRIDTTQLGKGFRKLAAIQASIGKGSFQTLGPIDLMTAMETKGQVGYTTIGGSIVIQSGGLSVGQLIFNYYTNPVVDESGFNSWVANNHPFAIIDDASAAVLYSVGNTERGNFFANLVGAKLPRPSGHVAEILGNNEIGYIQPE